MLCLSVLYVNNIMMKLKVMSNQIANSRTFDFNKCTKHGLQEYSKVELIQKIKKRHEKIKTETNVATQFQLKTGGLLCSRPRRLAAEGVPGKISVLWEAVNGMA